MRIVAWILCLPNGAYRVISHLIKLSLRLAHHEHDVWRLLPHTARRGDRMADAFEGGDAAGAVTDPSRFWKFACLARFHADNLTALRCQCSSVVEQRFRKP